MKKSSATRRISRGMFALTVAICLALACSGIASATDNIGPNVLTTFNPTVALLVVAYRVRRR